MESEGSGEVDDEQKARDKLHELREKRRKRILENSKARLEKLRSSQASEGAVKKPTEAPQHALIHTQTQQEGGASLPVADPPDEIIQPVTQPSTAQTGRVGASLLAGIVGEVRSNRGYKLRTAGALVCVLLVTLLNCVIPLYSVSYVMSILVLDCTLTLWLALTPRTQNTDGHPLGWLAMASIPLSFLHSSLPRIFEALCLSLLLLSVFVRDILFVVFCSIISIATVQFVTVLYMGMYPV